MARTATSDTQRIVGWFLEHTPAECEVMQDTIRAIANHKAVNGNVHARRAPAQAVSTGTGDGGAVPVKRRRGRPPKMHPTQPTFAAAEATPKRKRGRPPKITLANRIQPTFATTEAPKRKRGRPPKVRVAEAEAVAQTAADLDYAAIEE